MTRSLLWRGMLAGLVGALIAAAFALLFAEPQIDAAIALEAHHAMAGMAAGGATGGAGEPELVSRATQKTWGLFTAMGLYGTALGGLFAIVYAGLHGRVTSLTPRALALLMAIAAFAAIVLVPAIKYPPTPPAVGLHETVRIRTAAYFAMLALSIAAAIAAAWTFNRVRGVLLDRLLVALAAYVGLVALGQMLLPVVDEVPADFPATLLWQFRLAALGTQGVFWLATADLFGRAVEREFAR